MADSVSVASGVQTDKVEAFRQPSQNWFAKILHLKPATKVLALNVSNVRARKEVAKILREWKKYGIEGVRVDKQRNTVSARVGELNCEFPLSTSPRCCDTLVDIRAQFFVYVRSNSPPNSSRSSSMDATSVSA
jgi:dissimilatory sulfite reductase (desulfoviridin) alpha/beta subunit